ncbi:uncharacterized protein ppp1r1c isoform X2 [Amphiprion ocellaris]|uniref:uncharacterized protein ppp1r1c isoform X2 n=1 Tax=Amphiprion ocellaris TaxID=80972 RepID=UPI0024111B90|nr:uncharacterized protein ppp1r1c isoform X2 [Amphiprion ocellaris]
MHKVQHNQRSGPEILSLSRCAACYNQKSDSTYRWRNGGESSSSDEASGPEMESDAEFSSSSSSTEDVVAEKPERNSPVPGDNAEDEPRGQDGTSENQDEEQMIKEARPRAPFIRSVSLPSSFTPPLSRHERFISTLHLKVLSLSDDEDAVYSICKAEEKETKRKGGRLNSLIPPMPFQQNQMGLPWQQGSQPTLQQQQPSYQYQQLLPHQHQHHQQPHQYQQLPPYPCQYQPQPHPLLQQLPHQHQYHHQQPPYPCQYHQQPPYPYQYQQLPPH